MKRLTMFLNEQYYFKAELDKDTGEPILNEHAEKLGRYEDVQVICGDSFGPDPLKVLQALKSGFYYKKAENDDEICFWPPKTFGIRFLSGIGWCFFRISGGHTYHKTESNFGFEIDYNVVKLDWNWGLTKEDLE